MDVLIGKAPLKQAIKAAKNLNVTNDRLSNNKGSLSLTCFGGYSCNIQLWEKTVLSVSCLWIDLFTSRRVLFHKQSCLFQWHVSQNKRAGT